MNTTTTTSAPVPSGTSAPVPSGLSAFARSEGHLRSRLKGVEKLVRAMARIDREVALHRLDPTTPLKARRPSDRTRGWAYDDAAMIVRCFPDVVGTHRPGTVEELRSLAIRVRAHLGMKPATY